MPRREARQSNGTAKSTGQSSKPSKQHSRAKLEPLSKPVKTTAISSRGRIRTVTFTLPTPKKKVQTLSEVQEQEDEEDEPAGPSRELVPPPHSKMVDDSSTSSGLKRKLTVSTNNEQPKRRKVTENQQEEHDGIDEEMEVDEVPPIEPNISNSSTRSSGAESLTTTRRPLSSADFATYMSNIVTSPCEPHITSPDNLTSSAERILPNLEDQMVTTYDMDSVSSPTSVVLETSTKSPRFKLPPSVPCVWRVGGVDASRVFCVEKLVIAKPRPYTRCFGTFCKDCRCIADPRSLQTPLTGPTWFSDWLDFTLEWAAIPAGTNSLPHDPFSVSPELSVKIAEDDWFVSIR
ncbi:hypothetical protein DL96DRAFT_1721727 [Flagelloscypha sp. PMI_526]|nr:hypothetical protein DL96DRAFT_1721727 [Flagelloscypha sp. PMI_526]